MSQLKTDDKAIPRELVLEQLARILRSALFARSDRLTRFLQLSVQAALNGETDRLKEYVIGVEVFDRGDSFDPRIDPVVRVEARLLRERLRRWHETEGRDSTIVIDLPTGRYTAQFRYRGTSQRTGSVGPVGKAIAILPFINLNADPDLDYFSDGLTEELIHALTRLDRLRMTVQLINAADGHYLWSEAWDRPAADLLAIEEEIAQAIANKLRLDLGYQQRGTLLAQARNPESHTLYLKGRFHWNKRTPDGMQLAISYFKQAAEKDPSWPLAWAGLADAYAVLASYAIAAPTASLLAARDAAEKALALDASSAEAITCVAFVRAVYDWEWQEAGQLYQRAITLNPSYGTAHHWYGADYLAMLGRFDEAIAELETAITLDPLSSIILDSRAFLSMIDGRHDDALRRYTDLLQQDPWFYKGWSALGRLYAQMGKYAEAIQMFQKARTLAGDFPKILGALGQTYGLARQADKAREIMEILGTTSKTQYVGSTTFALVHLGLGQRDAALQRLETAAQEREQSILWLNIHPAWDTLRSEPRFKAILEHIHLA